MFSDNGKAVERIEFSFYCDKLKWKSVYKSIIQDFFPTGGRNYLSNYEAFNDVDVEHYWEKLFEGQKLNGGYIFI